ncbi:hypothetical protein F5B20DRAFT_574819 [Whalleya microplaca]|nr:hypothetical protein F5B20DRAFT_574819 [Whalleya microplaca]
MAPDVTRLQETANLQTSSTFFVKLPPEIRENEMLEALRQICQTRHKLRSQPLVMDNKWASRFSSTWHEHWKCEENMVAYRGNSKTGRRRLTLFLPVLLTCKRTYPEARNSLYTPITLTFTDLTTSHGFLVASQTIVPRPIHSLAFSLSIPFETLHQPRLDSSYPRFAGPWAELFWWQVRERWILSGIRGMLARCLTVQLPETTHLEWSRPYQYIRDDMTPFKLQRYVSLPWISFENGLIEPGMDSPRLEDDNVLAKETKLQKARRGIRELVSGLKLD